MFDFILMKLFGVKECMYGRDRQVFIFNDFVIKIPRTTSWKDFKRGLKSNRQEINVVKEYKGLFPEALPVILGHWCFGIFVVMMKYTEVKDSYDDYHRYAKRLTLLQDKEDPKYVDIWFLDNKVFNYGWDKYGRLVKIDIGVYE
ncbi:hypothetical protein [Aeromonas phage AerS_266]|nr:hypothetical protein [Aeromonas phage AerS_266]